MKMTRWARATLLIGVIMLSIAILPLWLFTTFFSSEAPVLFTMAFILVAPLGAIILCAGIILWLLGLVAK